MKKIFDKIDSITVRLLEWVLILTASAMVLLTFWQVIARYLLQISVPYAEEIARLMIVWCIFIGGALANRKSEHVKVEAFTNLLPGFLQKLFSLLAQLLIIAFSYAMIVYGQQYVLRVWPDCSTSLGYSRGWFFIPNVVAGVITMIYSILNVIHIIRSFFVKAEKTSSEEAS